MLIGYAFLQMAYNLHHGHSLRDEEQPPPPPPPTPAKLMQMVVEIQHLLAEAMRQLFNRDDQNVRQRPKPNQYSSFKDFMDMKPPIFREAEEPLQASSGIIIEPPFPLMLRSFGTNSKKLSKVILFLQASWPSSTPSS
jgi:hypothetical protein